jgi:hypothetical protein
MKKPLLFYGLLMILLTSCSLLHLGSGRQEKTGCPSGRNIGAEKIIAGDPKALADAKKARKFTKGMTLSY